MQINTKFSPGDVVWVMSENAPVRIRIVEVRTACADGGLSSISYVSERWRCYNEEELFSTKEELRKHLFGE